MPSLIAYRKVIDAVTTHQLKLPPPEKQGDQAAQEIATLADGRTVVVVFDGHKLPSDQPEAIVTSIETLPTPLPATLRDEISAASPHVRLIHSRLQERIRARYSAEDELKFNRIGTGHALGFYKASQAELDAIQAFGGYIQECRAWASAEKAKLGL